MTDSSEEGRQSDIATQEAKKISKSPFHLGGKKHSKNEQQGNNMRIENDRTLGML